ncbi:MAG: hypothetical protein LBD78_05760, partial [Spirochaetaceae bacterium]|nr:hypothetical protein [Spirochaetaceae bacterium]
QAARKTAAAGELESWQKAAAEDLAARKTAAAGELESWQKAAAEDLAARKTAAAGELESWQKAAAEDLAARKTAAEGDLAALESAAAAALEAWKQNMAEFERLVRIRRDDWDMAVEAKTRENRELIAEMENRVRELQNLVDARTAQVEAVFTEIMEQSEIKARTASATELDAWKSASAAELDSLKSAFAMEFDIRKTANDREHERWKNTAEADYLRWQESVLEEENRTRRLLTELEASSEDLKGRITGEFSVLEAKLRDFTGHSAEVVAGLERRLVDTADDMEQRVLETTEKRLEEYRQIQAEQYRRLETMAEDTGKLDAELRSYMADTEKRVEDDFALFERDAAARRNEVAAVFEGSVKALRDDMAGVERELASLKERAYENVSEKLRLFEDDFTADLSRRKGDIGVRLEEWKLALDRDLGLLGEQAGEERRRLELAFSEELKRRVAERQAELASALERLKVETGVFEDEIRNQISQAEETLAGYREQLNGDLEEARTGAETSVRAEIRQYALTTAETLKQAQRELAASLREIEEQVETRNAGVSELQESSRREIEEWQAKLAAQIRDADGILDDVRRRVRELVTESDERVASVRSAIEDVYTEADSRRVEVFAHTGEQVKLLDSAIKDADRHIREFIRETKLFEQTDALKLELQRRIEDFRSDLDHLDQRRSEAAELETQFIKIKRLEDDINNKMTRFLSEQRRIDRMEEAFNRLLLTSQGVEEKLSQVTASDDTLQAIQVQIRKLTDALDDTEERYQRIEKKNKTLETTTEGIDRNFKALDEAGAGLKRFEDELYRLSQEQDNLRQGIEKLAADSDKARMAAEKLSLLDTELSAIEKRIGDIQIAREWLARTVTQMEELDKEIQNRIKMAGNLAKDTLGKGPPKSKGAPPMATRDSAVKLARQGWTVDEIAAALKISRAEVELIIEMGPKD